MGRRLWRGQGTQDWRIVWLVAALICSFLVSRVVSAWRSLDGSLQTIHRRASATVQSHESLPMPPGHHDCG